MPLLSDLFSLSALERPVDRRTYFTVGVSLMVLKYVVDAAAIWWTLAPHSSATAAAHRALLTW